MDHQQPVKTSACHPYSKKCGRSGLGEEIGWIQTKVRQDADLTLPHLRAVFACCRPKAWVELRLVTMMVVVMVVVVRDSSKCGTGKHDQQQSSSDKPFHGPNVARDQFLEQ